MKYQIVYADPPWDYKGQRQHAGKGKPDTGAAVAHYDTMHIEDIKSMDLKSIVDNDESLLFMWSSSPHLPNPPRTSVSGEDSETRLISVSQSKRF